MKNSPVLQKLGLHLIEEDIGERLSSEEFFDAWVARLKKDQARASGSMHLGYRVLLRGRA